jgi:hypothetical protein
VTDWPEYESHKVVRAAKIVDITRTPDDELVIWVGDYPYERFGPTVDAMAEKAEIGGYAVVYPDGFKSISPAKAFEEGYTLKP